MRSLAIRSVETRDFREIVSIYNHYIENTWATFEETVISNAELSKRVENVKSAAFPWIVAEEAGVVVGYAYAGVWNARAAYRHTAECSVYLDPSATGRGIGTALYQDLLTRLRRKSLHAVIGGVALPNAASVSLHERFGFEKVAHFKEVGYKFDRWVDVGYWQLHLDQLTS